MANTVWAIANLERHLPDGEVCPDGAVYTAHWTASLEENGETASAYGSVGFSDPDPSTFTPYSQLTEAEVVNWVLAALGVDQVVSIEESLHNQIQERLNPTSASGVPW
jgi:hypothetical protein